MNVWSYVSTPPICLHGVDRDFIFSYLLAYVQDLLLSQFKYCIVEKSLE